MKKLELIIRNGNREKRLNIDQLKEIWFYISLAIGIIATIIFKLNFVFLWLITAIVCLPVTSLIDDSSKEDKSGK